MLGVVVLVASVLLRPKCWEPPPASERRRRRPRPAQGGLDESGPSSPDWALEVATRALTLRWEEGVTLVLNAGPHVPIELRLHQSTRDRSRRSVDALAAFLSAIPTPPRTRVVYDQCVEVDTARHKVVQGVFLQHFPPGALRTVNQRDHVDVLFSWPDARWAQLDRLPDPD